MTHVAFLRAVNVAGHARVAMVDVVQAFEQAGCRATESFGHAGNLLWTQGRGRAPVAELQRGLTRLLGQAPEIMVRTSRELSAIVEADPFGRLVDDRTVKPYVVFLAGQPKHLPDLPLEHRPERLTLIALDRRHAYVISRRKPNGFFGFPNQFVEKTLGVAATSRNWSTVVKAAARLAKA